MARTVYEILNRISLYEDYATKQYAKYTNRFIDDFGNAMSRKECEKRQEYFLGELTALRKLRKYIENK